MVTAMCISLLAPNQCEAMTVASETQETVEISDDILTAKLVAQTFIDSIADDNNGWDINNYIDEDFTILHNLQNEVCGYIFNVKNGAQSKGYITIGNVDNAYAIP